MALVIVILAERLQNKVIASKKSLKLLGCLL